MLRRQPMTVCASVAESPDVGSSRNIIIGLAIKPLPAQ